LAAAPNPRRRTRLSPRAAASHPPGLRAQSLTTSSALAEIANCVARGGKDARLRVALR
jgi:hypothetical protein